MLHEVWLDEDDETIMAFRESRFGDANLTIEINSKRAVNIFLQFFFSNSTDQTMPISTTVLAWGSVVTLHMVGCYISFTTTYYMQSEGTGIQEEDDLRVH